jgi:hypothetical protein
MNIINKPNTPYIETYSKNLVDGKINPLKRTSYKKLVNINSRFRDNYTTCPATNFFFNFPEIINKVVSMKLSNIILPNFVYTVNSNTGSDNFTVIITKSEDSVVTVITKLIQIPSGSYTAQKIVTKINSILSNSVIENMSYIVLKYDDTTSKMSFDISWNETDMTNITKVTFDFSYTEPTRQPNTVNNLYNQISNNIYKDQLTLGWLLGFRGNYINNDTITTTSTITTSTNVQQNTLNAIRNRHSTLLIKKNGEQYLEKSNYCCENTTTTINNLFVYNCDSNDAVLEAESIYDPVVNRYFMLSVNDFQNNHNRCLISPSLSETMSDINLLSKIYSNSCETFYENPERLYFGPSNISRLHIKLLDEFGRIVDLNNGDFSFTLEIEILYDL